MKVIKQSSEILFKPDNILELIETAGRTCYKSNSSGYPKLFVKGLISRGHHSVIEHANITARFITDRGVTHELVRHRLASYSQESTRYCNYANDRFGNELTFVEPVFWQRDSYEYIYWWAQMCSAERTYMWLIDSGAKPEEARGVLPNSLKTEIVVTANVREWRHIISLRSSEKAHPQIRALIQDFTEKLKTETPEVLWV